MKKTACICFLIGAVMLGIAGCHKHKHNAIQTNPTQLFFVPNGWPQPQYNFTNNAVTNNRFLLGKKLFYDPILSRDSTISCGSCHFPDLAFSDSPNALSTGVGMAVGKRNSPPLFNLAWHTHFMWDGGVNHIEVQPIAPILNSDEMDENLLHVITKLNASDTYKQLFLHAYGTDSITSQLTFRAMAQFMACLISSNAKYDKVMRGETYFTTQEQRGYVLFETHCNSCHTQPLFTNFSFENNGLPLNPLLNDYGRYRITFNPSDSMKFKIPALRNIAVTAPYMHDGRFNTLLQALNHYASGIVSYSNLNPELVGGIALSEQDKHDLVAFLQTLTDYDFLEAARFKP